MDTACLSSNSDACSQIWYINVNVDCPFMFDGDFALQFTANCVDDDDTECLNYTATYGSVVSLSTGLTFKDYICYNYLYLNTKYNFTMDIYGDDNFTSPMSFFMGDRVYVQISVDDN